LETPFKQKTGENPTDEFTVWRGSLNICNIDSPDRFERPRIFFAPAVPEISPNPLSVRNRRKLAPSDPNVPDENDIERWRAYWSRLIVFEDPDKSGEIPRGITQCRPACVIDCRFPGMSPMGQQEKKMPARIKVRSPLITDIEFETADFVQMTSAFRPTTDQIRPA